MQRETKEKFVSCVTCGYSGLLTNKVDSIIESPMFIQTVQSFDGMVMSWFLYIEHNLVVCQCKLDGCGFSIIIALFSLATQTHTVDQLHSTPLPPSTHLY